MRKKIKILFIALVTSAIPTALSYLGGADNILDTLSARGYIGNSVDLHSIKMVCQIISGLLTFVLITYNMAVSNWKNESKDIQINSLLYQNKTIFERAFSNIIGNAVNLDVRIFVPEERIIDVRKNKIKYFKIKNYEGLCTAGTTNDLKFAVHPHDFLEGLVGQCYDQKSMLLEDNLKEYNNTQYNLNRFQISKTRDLEFSIVCPLFKDGNNDEVVAVVAVDGKQKISINNANRENLINSVLTFSQLLYENVPELFKPIRRLI